MQRYIGKNFQNNSVIVDFTKKKVRFKPIICKSAIKKNLYVHYYELLANNIQSISIRVFLWFFALGFLSGYFDGWINVSRIRSVTLIWGITTYVGSYLIALIFFNKKFRENYLPKVYAILFRIKGLIILKDVQKERTFTSKQINKKLKIDFGNIYLEYNATGDVAKQLKKLRIEPLSKYDTGEWFAIFELKRRAKNGELSLTYI